MTANEEKEINRIDLAFFAVASLAIAAATMVGVFKVIPFIEPYTNVWDVVTLDYAVGFLAGWMATSIVAVLAIRMGKIGYVNERAIIND